MVNDSIFSLTINPTDNYCQTIKKTNNIIYLFLCPHFANSEVPLRAQNPQKAPFQILPQVKKIYPAYFIYKGQIHFGYQINSSQKRVTSFKVKLTLRPLSTIGKKHRFESAQFIMFDNTRSFRPLDVKTVVIYHPPHIISVINKLDEERPQISQPIPYHHSPNIYPICHNPQCPQLPLSKTIGDHEHLFFGASDSHYHHIIQITSKLLQFKPQLSFVATQYLCTLNEGGYSNWFDKHLLAIIYDEPLQGIQGKKDIILPISTNFVPTITQTVFNKEDKAVQTDMSTAKDIIPKSPIYTDAFLDDLLQTFSYYQPPPISSVE